MEEEEGVMHPREYREEGPPCMSPIERMWRGQRTNLTLFSRRLRMAKPHLRDPNKERYWKKVLYEADNYRHIYNPLKALDNILLPVFKFLEPLCWNMVIRVKA